MLKIKGIEKLLPVNPHLRCIEEFRDRYRLHLNHSEATLPLLIDIHKSLSESNDISIRLHSVSTDSIFDYNSFPMHCSLRTFSDIHTFTQYLDILIETWRKGGLSGSRLGVNLISPKGDRIWVREKAMVI